MVVDLVGEPEPVAVSLGRCSGSGACAVKPGLAGCDAERQ